VTKRNGATRDRRKRRLFDHPIGCRAGALHSVGKQAGDQCGGESLILVAAVGQTASAEKSRELCPMRGIGAYGRGSFRSADPAGVKHERDHQANGEALSMFAELGNPRERLDRRQRILHHHQRDSFLGSIDLCIANDRPTWTGPLCAALDMDQDGWIDVAFWGVWFKNPGKSALGGTRWEAIGYDGGGHDVVAADVNGDGTLDLVTYDGHDLCWFDPANKLAKTIIAHNRKDHGGIAPRGIGDLNGDGRADIVVPGVWLENPGPRNSKWPQHPWPHRPVDKASYGTSMRAWIADINRDGHNDIVYSDCDTGFSHVYWVANGGKGSHWTGHQLPDPPGDERTGSFHSLAVVDFDRDGRLEIFAGEQEDPATYMTAEGLLPMKPPGLKKRGVIWAGTNEPDVEFTPVVIHTGNPGWHDAVVYDVDGDGDADIVSKVWNADGPTYHVDYWRNDIRSRQARRER